MAVKKGDEVYIPRSVLGLDENDISPFYKTTVREIKHPGKLSVKVDVPGGALSKWVAVSRITRHFGVLVIRIGDFNEEGLLDPLAKAVLHYCRMLLPGDSVRVIELRTEEELERLWESHHGMCHQVILVGHGSKDGFQFGDKDVRANQMAAIFDRPKPTPKEFISLGCQTGLREFGKVFSQANCVSHLLAPFHSIHGCAASLFAQTYMHERLIAARSAKVAYNHARDNLKGAASFRLWIKGDLYTD